MLLFRIPSDVCGEILQQMLAIGDQCRLVEAAAVLLPAICDLPPSTFQADRVLLPTEIRALERLGFVVQLLCAKHALPRHATRLRLKIGQEPSEEQEEEVSVAPPANAELDEDGLWGGVAWTLNGRLHRDGDLPAVERWDGTLEWWCHGVRHRDNDRPALIVHGHADWSRVHCHLAGSLDQALNPANLALFQCYPEVSRCFVAPEEVVVKDATICVGAREWYCFHYSAFVVGYTDLHLWFTHGEFERGEAAIL